MRISNFSHKSQENPTWTHFLEFKKSNFWVSGFWLVVETASKEFVWNHQCWHKIMIGTWFWRKISELWFCTENFGIFPMSHFEWFQEISQISVKKNILLRFLHCCWRENRCQENSENSTFFKFWKKMRGGKGPSKAIKIAVFPFFLKLPIQMCNFLCKYLGAITVIAQLMLSAFLWPFHASKMRNRIFHDFLGSLPYLATSIFPSLKRFKMTSLAICILSTMFENH